MDSSPQKIEGLEKTLLCLGFGDLAARISAKLSPAGWQISGLKRGPGVMPLVRLVRGDVRDRELLHRLLMDQPVQVLVTLTPDQRDELGYRCTYVEPMQVLTAVCAELSVRPHILFVSSTAVYGQADGSWVDEDSPTLEPPYNGRILLEAENVLRESGLPWTILRFAGIYGRAPERRVEAVRQGRWTSTPDRWTNRIHIEDCVGILVRVLDRYADQNLTGGLLNGSDSQPCLAGDLDRWIALQLGLQPPDFAASQGRYSGRRCDNSRLATLGYSLRYPDYRSGYLLEGR